jgi:hypothetical protein
MDNIPKVKGLCKLSHIFTTYEQIIKRELGTPNLSTFYANSACQPHGISSKNKYRNSPWELFLTSIY